METDLEKLIHVFKSQSRLQESLLDVLVREKQAIVGHTLLRRTGKIDDVVRAVRFLLTEAPFMTGSILRLDGGYVLGGEVVPPMPEGVE